MAHVSDACLALSKNISMHGARFRRVPGFRKKYFPVNSITFSKIPD
jgi:hypothetical protein